MVMSSRRTSAFTIGVPKREEDLVQRVTQRLGQLRHEAKITQQELAEVLEVPVQHVSRIEGGQNVTLATLERIAIALGMHVSVIFEPADEGPRKPPPSRRQAAKAATPRRSRASRPRS
jgi:transcriptional regulator with XRE-family HTH domain